MLLVYIYYKQYENLWFWVHDSIYSDFTTGKVDSEAPGTRLDRSQRQKDGFTIKEYTICLGTATLNFP